MKRNWLRFNAKRSSKLKMSMPTSVWQQVDFLLQIDAMSSDEVYFSDVSGCR